MSSEHLAHHRPRYHISQQAGYLNDPNGPVEVGVTTHLFFQSRPTTDTDDPVEWGHATSRDLVDWAIHPSAMRPTTGGLDADGCWSGNAVRSDDGIRAFYSGHDRTRPLERVLTAVSRDAGMTFGRPELVMPDPDPGEGVRMLRDPFVWADEQGRHMVLGSIVGDRAAMRLYEAVDDSTWRHVGELASRPRTTVGGIDTGEGWECPQIIRLDGQEVALVGSWSFEGGTARVLAFPATDASSVSLFDDGDSFYAPSVMRDSSHGPIVFGWLRETREPDWWHEAGWAGALALPRRAWLADGTVRSEPVPALDRLRREVSAGDGITIGAQAELVLDHVSGVTRIAFGPDEWLDLETDVAGDVLTIDRTHASRDTRAEGSVIRIANAFDTGADRPAVRVLLDGSVAEVFTSAGRSAATRVYPLTPPPWRVEVSDGGRVWRLRDAVTASRAHVPAPIGSSA